MSGSIRRVLVLSGESGDLCISTFAIISVVNLFLSSKPVPVE